ncbi:hypothetical protein [Rossellomorea marisflavi]|uniref:hypothetical protein n=1 Tax=Rossellomorea marisflavi TaxID=189381 RepID=UPI00064E2468|nr:hypothetical protein [Rossellomorea marisflavi]KML32366.1 hypothetical protein VL12_15310 [Rossellomorea marisflavi]
MFGWDIHSSQSDRLKFFFFLLAVFLVIGFSVTFVFRSNHETASKPVETESGQTVESPSSESGTSVVEPNETTTSEEENTYDQTEHFTEKELEESKEVAVAFARSFHSYSADEPGEYLEKSKHLMTVSFYKKKSKDDRREPLGRSYLAVDETSVTPVVNKSTSIIRWNVMVTGEAKAPDGSKTKTEDWYLVSVRQEEGEWKVEDVRVNVPN